MVACGDDSDSEVSSDASELAVTITEDEQGSGSFDVPSEATGGLVEMTVTNDGEAPHEAGLVYADDGHTTDEILEVISSEGAPPEWLHGAGGVGRLDPGESGTAILNLEPADYLLIDIPEGGKAPPGTAELTVSGGEEGDLPETDATITAAELETGSDSTEEESGGKPEEEYDWETSGLVAGENEVTFVSEGEDALHHIIAVPIVGDATFEDVQAEFASKQQGPPKTVDFENGDETAVFDGETSGVVDLNLEAGRYALICFFSDKGEKTPHFQEGLFDEVEVPEG